MHFNIILCFWAHLDSCSLFFVLDSLSRCRSITLVKQLRSRDQWERTIVLGRLIPYLSGHNFEWAWRNDSAIVSFFF